MVALNTETAVTRETAWLNTAGDGLPALTEPNGGPWDTITAYYPRTPYQERRTIYVMRHKIQQKRFGAQRVLHTYPFRLILWWPLLDREGSAEADAQLFDDAIDLLLQRILGPLGDKTHGGRFLSTGEGALGDGSASRVDVDYTDPEQTLLLGGLRAEVSYSADDIEVNA
jgi:hypothetical protein